MPCPCIRQEQILTRIGIDLPRAALVHLSYLVRLSGQAPERRFDVEDAEQAQQADGEVPQAGEDTRGVAMVRMTVRRWQSEQ